MIVGNGVRSAQHEFALANEPIAARYSIFLTGDTAEGIFAG
jgi:hypothetical protein